MNCDELLPLIEEVFDGEADQRTARRVEAHLAACPACAGAFESLRSEQDLYLSHEYEAAPTPAFWREVMARAGGESGACETAAGAAQIPPAQTSARLSLRRARRWLATLGGASGAPRISPTLAAALILIAVALTVGVMRHLNSREPAMNETAQGTVDRQTRSTPDKESTPTPSTPASTTRVAEVERAAGGNDAAGAGRAGANGEQRAGAATEGRNETAKKSRIGSASSREGVERLAPLRARQQHQATPEELVREAEQKYLAAIAILSRDVRRNRPRLGASTVERFEQTLATIDRTIAGTRRAVRQHPGDPVAVNYMLMAYAKKVEILREMASH